MTLQEKAVKIGILTILLGEDTFTDEAWRRFRIGLPLALMLGDEQITVEEGSEAEGFINEVWDWVSPAWDIVQSKEE
jgi:hypothetical protein